MAALHTSLPVPSMPEMSSVEELMLEIGSTQMFSNDSNESIGQMKGKILSQRLALIHHAHRCLESEKRKSGEHECAIPYCQNIKNVLRHMKQCQEGEDCKEPSCRYFQGVLLHWYKGVCHDCNMCMHVNEEEDKRMQKGCTDIPLSCHPELLDPRAKRTKCSSLSNPNTSAQTSNAKPCTDGMVNGNKPKRARLDLTLTKSRQKSKKRKHSVNIQRSTSSADRKGPVLLPDSCIGSPVRITQMFRTIQHIRVNSNSKNIKICG